MAVASCGAAEYTFDLPELLGSPDGDQNLSIDLGGEFASISGARLRIAGMHHPGLLGNLHSPPTMTFPYPASIDAYSPAQPFNQSGILGELLSTDVGPFEVDEAFHRIQPGGPPDFTNWLDGTANFHFSAGPSAYIAIYRTISNPVVNITSATLTVTGERLNAAADPSADFDGDGTVDGDDLVWWQTAFGPSNPDFQAADADRDGDADGIDFLVWQRQLNSEQCLPPRRPSRAVDGGYSSRWVLAAVAIFTPPSATNCVAQGHLLGTQPTWTIYCIGWRVRETLAAGAQHPRLQFILLLGADNA